MLYEHNGQGRCHAPLGYQPGGDSEDPSGLPRVSIYTPSSASFESLKDLSYFNTTQYTHHLTPTYKCLTAEHFWAIRSMFRWYRSAARCYVYLFDVHGGAICFGRAAELLAFRQSRWFTRGRTLQELFAPSVVDFFSKDGKKLSSKLSHFLPVTMQNHKDTWYCTARRALVRH